MSYSPLVTGLVGSLGGLTFGYVTGIIAVASGLITDDFGVTEDHYVSGFVTSIILFGAVLGSFVGGTMASYLGRTTSCYIASGICLFGVVTTVLSPYLWTYMLFRFICGIGIGLVCIICPMYVSETAPVERKGTYGVMFQLMVTLGIVISDVVGYLLSELSNKSLAWRLMIGSGGSLLTFALMIVSFTKMQEPSSSLSGAEAINSGTSLIAPGEKKKKKSSVLTLLSRDKLKQTFTGLILAVTLQLTGINAIMYYGPVIIQSAGLKDATALNIGIGGWNFLATFIAVFLVEKLGRRKLMLGGTFLMSLSLIVVGISMSEVVSSPTGRGIGVAVGLFFFLAGFEGGVGCLFWVLVNEIFEDDIKETGASFCNAAQWIFNILVSSFYGVVVIATGSPSIVFFIFGGFGVACTVLLFFLLTEKKTIEVIE